MRALKIVLVISNSESRLRALESRCYVMYMCANFACFVLSIRIRMNINMCVSERTCLLYNDLGN
jgi:hypothetical protein